MNNRFRRLSYTRMSMVGIKVADLEVLPDELVERYQKSYKKGRRHFLDKIVLHNIKLVIHLANQYYPPAGYDHEDLVMAGTPGLYTAARRWRREKGASFGTYAAYHIKHHIRRFIQKNCHVVNVPFRFNDALAAAHREKRELEADLGHDIREGDERLSRGAQRIFSRTVQRVDIDGQMNPETGEPCTLELPDTAEVPVLGEEEKTVLHRLITELPGRLQVILRARFGFNDPDRIQTLEQVAAGLGVTRERVRQLENVALNKLRSRLRHLQRRENLALI